MKDNKLVKNAIGRFSPETVNGKKVAPYMGVGKYRPEGFRKAPKINTVADFPYDGNKQVKSLKEALVRAGLKDGQTISTHHHFRKVLQS